MRPILFLFLLLPSIAFAGDKEKEFKKLKLDDKGQVYFEEIYNVNKRSNEQILKYAIAFAKDNGITATPEMIDKEKEEITFEYTWKLKAKQDFGAGITSLTAKITIGAKSNRTKMLIHDFYFTSKGPCKDGRLESLVTCPDGKQSYIRNAERWMEEEIGEHFYWAYKHHLEEATSKDKGKW